MSLCRSQFIPYEAAQMETGSVLVAILVFAGALIKCHQRKFSRNLLAAASFFSIEKLSEFFAQKCRRVDTNLFFGPLAKARLAARNRDSEISPRPNFSAASRLEKNGSSEIFLTGILAAPRNSCSENGSSCSLDANSCDVIVL
jgi:hypothetical protein